MRDGLSVYVHIPFCRAKCAYCDFPSFAGKEENIPQYLNALISEIRDEGITAGRAVETVYFGGGTPSYVPSEMIGRVMEELSRKYDIREGAEITLEMNPGTSEREKLKGYRKAGINRISLGCQSFNDKTLKRLGRIHRQKDITETFRMLREEGFDNINCDLISSLPGETGEDLMNSLRQTLELRPEHVSVYSLILEPGTRLQEEYAAGKLKDLPDEDQEAENDETVKSFLEGNGYNRYEISNYALPGYECAHNLTYWRRGDYRGFGLSAASLVGNRRFTNAADFTYTDAPGKLLSEDRILTENEAMSEFMFLGLRCIKGVSKERFRESFGRPIEDVFGEAVRRQKKEGLLREENGYLSYNDRGLNVSSILLSEFLI